MSILETLAHDHRTLEAIATELAATTSAERERRIEIFTRLQALLVAHSRAEEEIVYRRLRARLPEEAGPLEAYEEHHVADILLQELASDCPGGVGWSAKVRVLDELLRHHIKEEELELFALVRENFDLATQNAMDDEFRLLKHEPVEAMLAPVRRATPAFAGRAGITAQAMAGRLARRGELYVRRTLSRLQRRRTLAPAPIVQRAADIVVPRKARSRKARAV